MLARRVFSSVQIKNSNTFRLLSTVPPKEPAAPAVEKMIVVKKSNINQSPWKMRFLVTLAHEKWLPDALAQMKFSPKHKSEDIAKLLLRGSAMARINYQAIPEELFVKEVFVTKGKSYKRLRIMGRGRAGVGYKRYTHVTAKVEVIDFDKKIAEAKTANQKKIWQMRKQLVEDKKKNVNEGLTLTPAAPESA